MVKKVIALFVEGPTEVEFYKAIVKNAHDRMLKIQKNFDCKVVYKNMCGIGNYKKDALRKFKKIKEDHPGLDIYAYLCIDTDVFEFSKRPPIDKNKIQDALKEAGAKKVIYIEANRSIEDWFLKDLNGVLNYLGLPKSTKKPAGSGQEALEKLFKSANKLYVKGSKTEGFIKKLNIPLIMVNCCEMLKSLCDEMNFSCSDVCNR